MRKLKPFGEGGLSHNWGYSLPILIGHLEDLVDQEGYMMESNSGGVRKSKTIKTKRFEKVEAALSLLNEALEMGGEE